MTGITPVYGAPAVAAGGLPSVSVTVAEAIVTLTLPVVVFTGELESLAATMMVSVPPLMGVPVMVQLLLSVRPDCSAPDLSAQV